MAETTQAVQAKPKRGMSKSLRDSLVAYSFIAPNFIGFCIFTLVPMIFAIGLSFCNWDGVHPVEFTGIRNFVALLSDKTFKAAFVNTLVYAIGTVPLTLVCSLGLAMLLNQKVKFRNFFRTVSFFPYVASLVAVAAVWNMIFSPSMGPVNQILATLGVENLPKWAAGKDTAMLTVILFSVWKNMGYYMVIYLAGLQGTNPELEEAAELDGASKWQIFWNVTLPQLKPTTFFVIIMLTIASFKVYDQMYMITQGGPRQCDHDPCLLHLQRSLRQHTEVWLRKCRVHGAVCAGAVCHHHPVQGLVQQRLREGGNTHGYYRS